MATELIEGKGASLDVQLFQTEEGEITWAILYTSQHPLASEQIGKQQRKIILGLSEILVRLDPPARGLGVVTADADGEPYNMVVVLSMFADLWAAGTFSDAEFADMWVIIEP